MTDTPRTKAELLDIFATNGVGAIDAQDVRDFVVSMSAYGGHALSFTIYDGGANFVTLANDTWTMLPFNANAAHFTQWSSETNVDVSPTGTYASDFLGFTFTDQQYLRVPAGIWRWAMAIWWEPNIVGVRRAFLQTADDRVFESIDPTFTAPAFVPDMSLAPTDANDAPAPVAPYQYIAGETYVTQAMIDADGSHLDAGKGWAIAPYAKQTSGGSLGIISIGVTFVRVGFA